MKLYSKEELLQLNNLKKGNERAFEYFFNKYYDAKLNWVQVNNHMENHCDFKKISTKKPRLRFQLYHPKHSWLIDINNWK